MEWEDVTHCFSEKQRNYNDKYLEIDEVYDNKVEVSLFSSEDDLYEIYFSYGKMYGIIYVEKDESHALRQEIKEILAKEYQKDSEPSSDFINEFCEKYNVCLPNDLFFNFSF